MSNDSIAPINHSKTSALASVGTGVASGGAKGAIVGWLLGGLIPVAATVGAIAFFSLGGWALAGAVAVGTVATYFGSIAGGAIGTGLGLWKGGSKAIDQVKMEQGLANTISANVAVSKYQAQAMTQASNDNQYDPFPQQGTQMNAAVPTLQTNTIQNDGRTVAPQLAVANSK